MASATYKSVVLLLPPCSLTPKTPRLALSVAVVMVEKGMFLLLALFLFKNGV